jgi:hypothetical protein
VRCDACGTYTEVAYIVAQPRTTARWLCPTCTEVDIAIRQLIHDGLLRQSPGGRLELTPQGNAALLDWSAGEPDATEDTA